MPSQLSLFRLLSLRASRLCVALATVLLMASSVEPDAQGSVTPHFTAALSQVGSTIDAYAANAVAVDSAGNVYIAGSVSGVATLLKETNRGGNFTESTILTGAASIHGMVFDAADNLFLASGSNILKIPAGSTTPTVLITGSNVYYPVGLTLDSSGNIYIANDGYPTTVDKATLQGNGSYILSTIYTATGDVRGVAVDAAGNIYWTDSGGHVYEETLSAGTYTHTTFSTAIGIPSGILFDAKGNLVVTDANTVGKIYKFTNNGGGAFSAANAILTYGLTYPYQPALDTAGNLYIPDNASGRFLKFQQPSGAFPDTNVAAASTTKLSIVFNLGSGGHFGPPAVVTQGATSLDFTDAGTGTCNTNGASHTYSAGDSCTVDVTFTPKAPGRRVGAVILYDTSNNALATGYLSGTGLGPLVGFDAGAFTTLGFTGLGSNSDFNKVVADASGNLYLAERTHCEIVKYVPSTSTTTILAGSGTCATASADGTLAAGSTIKLILALAINGRGDLFFNNLYQIRKIDAVTGLLSTVANTANASGYSPDGTLGSNAQFDRIPALLVDGANNLYISDDSHNLVRRLDATTGVLTTVAGSYNGGAYGFGGDGGPATSALMHGTLALALDAAGNLYTADDGSNVIRKISAATGIITTVAGVAPAPYSGGAAPSNNGHDGDGGPATSAHIDDPEGLAVDAAGNLYIADSNNNVIRRVDASTQIISALGGFYTNGGAAAPYTTDGHAGNLTQMGYAQDVTIAQDGSMYILDNDSAIVHRIAMGSAIAEFGSAQVNDATPAIDVVLDNIGNAPLALSTITPSTNFNVQGPHTSCSSTTSLATAATCTLGVEFLPTTTGLLPGTITLTDNANNTASSTQTVNLSGTGTPQVATQIAVSGLPATQPSGVPLASITADIEDASGAVVLASTATVTVTITGPGGYSQAVTATAVNGVVTLNVSGLPAFTPPGTYTVTTTSSGLSTATTTFTVNPPASQIAVTTPPATLPLTGNLGTQTATLEDANGNVVTAPAVSITTTVTGPGGYSHTVSGTTVNGVVTLDLSTLAAFNLPGTYTETTTSSSGLPPITSTFTVTPPATQIAVSALPLTLPLTGNLGNQTATVEDVNGNVVLSPAATITTTITGPGGYSHTVSGTTVNGIAILNLSGLPPFTVPGLYTVTTTSPNLPTVTSTCTVGVPTQLAVSPLPASLPVGGALGVETATFKDANGNVATGSSAVATTTITGPGGYSQTVSAAAVNGVATFNLSGLPPFTTPGTYTVTTSSPNLPTVTSTFIVGATAAKIVVSPLPATLPFGGNLGTVTATLEDNSNNVATSSTAVVTVTITGPGGYTHVVTGTAVNGVVTFNLGGLAFTTPGTYTTTISSPNLPAVISTFTVAAPTLAQPAQLTLTGLPALIVQGGNLGTITGSVETTTGSVVITSTAPVTITITGPGGYLQTLTVPAVSGVASFNLSTYTFTALGTYTVTLSSPGLPSSSFTFTVSQDFTVGTGSGPGSTTTSAAPPQTVLPGAAATYPLVIAPAGTTFTGPITLSASGLPPGATYSFNPPVVTPGPTAATSTLTITTAASSARLRGEGRRFPWSGSLAFTILLLPFAASRRLRHATRTLSAGKLTLAMLCFGGLVTLAGCAGGGLYGHGPQSYTITITATSGAISHSTTVMLIEQ